MTGVGFIANSSLSLILTKIIGVGGPDGKVWLRPCFAMNIGQRIDNTLVYKNQREE
jgi:hypothetical protein